MSINFEWIRRGKKNTNEKMLILNMENVSVYVGQRLVLEDISLKIFEGDQLRITGPNGSGKSTLLNAIAGVIPLSSGSIYFKRADVSILPTHERVALGIKYMRQSSNVFLSLAVAENLTLALGGDGYARFSKQFPQWAQDMPANKKAGLLSGGQKQKLAWAMTVLSQCELALMDEPIAGMYDGKNLIEELNVTSIFIEHH